MYLKKIETLHAWHLNKIFNNANLIYYQEEYAVAPNQVKIFVLSCFINTLTFISICCECQGLERQSNLLLLFPGEFHLAS